MASNIEYFIKQKYQEINFQGTLRTEELYKGYCSENPYFEKILAIMHQEYNRLFSFMYSKLKFNAHYNANESRILLYYIKLYNDMISTLKNTKYSFEIREEYLQLIESCSAFLQESRGSDLPNDLPIIELLNYEPIFMMCQRVSIANRTEQASFPIKLIGEGSYAHVFKYKDDFYNKFFVIKRAKNNLNPKELQRFKKEYEVMKALHSPHVLEVYRYNDEKNEYYAEYANETLLDFIQRYPQFDIAKRKSIANQLFRGLSYIHKKRLLHRDLSLSNILLFHYDDGNTIVKLSDFGLVKEENSTLTSLESEVKGSLNDSNLNVIGFSNFSIVHETFALTRVILFIMTGLQNMDNIRDDKIKQFVLKGIGKTEERYQTVDELKAAFSEAFK